MDQKNTQPNIWIDADACPKAIKTILLRASERVGVTLIFVANQALFLPRSERIRSVVVDQGFDIADQYIVSHCEVNDLIVTADIPLAADAVKKGALALNPRGKLYNKENINEILSMRDAMAQLRDAGVARGGPSQFTNKHKQAFANALDRWIARK